MLELSLDRCRTTSSRLNSHTARVACNVCHVPTFAKGAPTDMRRDWSLPGDLNAETRLYEPHMVLQTNVTPVYRFFNGRSTFYEFATPAVPQANGLVLMAGPLGSRAEPGAKITAMKRHDGSQPIDPVTRRLLPLKIGIFFQTGDIVRRRRSTQGAAASRAGRRQRLRVRRNRALHGRLPRGRARVAGAHLLTPATAAPG